MEIVENNKEDNKGKLKENFIVGIINVEESNLKEIIINSYENVKREELWRDWDEIKVNKNEKEIKNCEVFINEKK